MGKKIVKLLIIAFVVACTYTNVLADDEIVSLITYDMQNDVWSEDFVKDGFEETVSPPENDSKVETFSIFGEDERIKIGDTTKAPYSYIGSIITLNQAEIPISEGTAWLVGDSLAITAAHNVYNTKNQPKEIIFTLLENGGKSPYGDIKVTKWHIPQQFIEQKKKEPQKTYPKYDYAILELDKPIGKKNGYFSVENTFTVFDVADNFDIYENEHTVKIAGYPSDHAIVYSHYMYASKGKSYFDGSDYVLYYKIDTFSGESGAPVFYKSGNKYYALGIHLYGKSEKNGVEWNRGRRITKGIVQAVNKYK